MLRRSLAALAALLLAACYTNVFSESLETCEEVDAEIKNELQSIQSCTADSECGTELKGTSCGCTNNLVARTGVDTSRFDTLRSRRSELECEVLSGTCDCPSADGFVCKDGVCAWNYLP